MAEYAMRILRNIWSQLHVYLVWLILGAVGWGFVFGILTDAPTEKKLVLFAEVGSIRDRELAADLEKEKPEGIRMIQVHSFDYVMLDESGLLNADLYIIPAENTENYRDSFRPLDPEKLPADYGGVLEREGPERASCDYISGMTDGYAMEKYGELFIPFAWTVK